MQKQVVQEAPATGHTGDASCSQWDGNTGTKKRGRLGLLFEREILIERVVVSCKGKGRMAVLI